MNQKCILCRSDKYKKLFDVDGYDIKKCTKCGLVKTFGQNQSKLDDYHRDSDYKKYEQEFENIFKLRFNRIKHFKKDPGRILDIGCSTGLLLQSFKKHGWEVWGIEPSKSGNVAKKRGVKVVKSSFEKANLKSNFFDVVVLNHTLEHVSDPFKVLKKVNSLLKKGGVLYVDVPNFGSWDLKIRQMHWPYLLPEEHIHHFTEKSLVKIVNKTGFKAKRIRQRSGLFDVANPLLKLSQDMKNRPIAFVNDIMDLPGNIVTTVFNRGDSLSIIAVK